MTSLFVEQLTVIDCSYLDAVRGLVGESWIVDIELIGDLDDQSMVLDFGEVKRRLKLAIDGSVDHTLVVPRRAAELSLVERADKVELLFRSDQGAFEHLSPAVAISLVDAATIDTAAVIAYLKPRLVQVLPANVSELRLQLRNERIEGAYYHYTHGLKKHRGHCQRIAHGHRSHIEIRVDGTRAAQLEAELAARWLDIYLGSDEDIVARGNGRLRYAYDAPEGRFEIALPEARVECMQGDTTVERIAEWIAQLPRSAAVSGELEVRAYEGVMKGAIARRTIAA